MIRPRLSHRLRVRSTSFAVHLCFARRCATEAGHPYIVPKPTRSNSASSPTYRVLASVVGVVRRLNATVNIIHPFRTVDGLQGSLRKTNRQLPPKATALFSMRSSRPIYIAFSAPASGSFFRPHPSPPYPPSIDSRYQPQTPLRMNTANNLSSATWYSPVPRTVQIYYTMPSSVTGITNGDHVSDKYSMAVSWGKAGAPGTLQINEARNLFHTLQYQFIDAVTKTSWTRFNGNVKDLTESTLAPYCISASTINLINDKAFDELKDRIATEAKETGGGGEGWLFYQTEGESNSGRWITIQPQPRDGG